jgi:hypothetical protein
VRRRGQRHLQPWGKARAEMRRGCRQGRGRWEHPAPL